MRLVTRKLWRAFPELDPYDDLHGRAFVRTARRAFWPRVLRLALSLGAGVVTVGVIVAPLVLIWQGRGSEPAWLWIGLATAFVAAGLATMVVRDRLLRRRIGTVLRTQGVCQNCRYNLLGVPVSPELKVSCPECGLTTTVDPALGELVTSAQGVTTFRPTTWAKDAEAAARWARRRRLALRGLVASVVGVVGLVGAVALTWYLQTVIDARAARADRNYAQAAEALIQNVQPPGDVDPAEGWKTFAQLLADVKNAQEAAMAIEVAKERYAALDARELYIDYASTYEPYTPAPELDPEGLVSKHTEARRDLALAAIEALRSDGTLAKLEQLRTLTRVARPVDMSTDGHAVGILLPTLAPARNLARLNAARATLALRAGDRAEYIAAIDQSLALARVLEMQGTLLDRLVAIAIDALVALRVRTELAAMPDEAWVIEVQRVLDARRPRVPFEHALEGERLAGRDLAAWFFSDVERVRTASVTGKIAGVTGGGPSFPVRVGRYRTNLREIDERVQLSKDLARLAPFERQGITPPLSDAQGYLSSLVVGHQSRALRSMDQSDIDLRGTRVMLAIERFTRRTGARPTSLLELSEADGLNPSDRIDPFSGKPFGYRTFDRNAPDARAIRHPLAANKSGARSDATATRDNYLLWSVGLDGASNNGAHAIGYGAFMELGVGLDHVINNSE